jgi:hypothetical protein
MFKPEGVQYVFDGIIDEWANACLLQYMCLSDVIRAIQYVWEWVAPYHVTLDKEIIGYWLPLRKKYH